MIQTKALIKKLYPKRPPQAHKGQFGRLLVVGGSRVYSGAPALAALAAIRSGCDLVKVASPQRPADIVAGFSPDLITWPLKGDFLNPWHLPDILKLAGESGAAVIGSGLGRHPQTQALVQQFLRKTGIPCVIDADAIHALARARNLKLRENCILTPHSLEFQALSGKAPDKKTQKRMEQVRALSKKLGCTVLLKGHVDIISDGREVAANRTGTPFMTKGGTGDTLAGIAGALLARDNSPLLSACAAAYINGLAGELASRESGESLMASDLLDYIPRVLKL